MEGQPSPTELKTRKEDEVRDAIKPSVAHLAFGGIRRRFLRPEQQTVGAEDTKALQSATPDALNPLVNGANALSVESRQEAPQIGEKEWNQKVWTLLNSYVAEGVDADLRDERLKAFAALDLKLENAEQDANGLYTQVEVFRQRYVDYDSSNIGGFVEDVARDCKNDDGSTDLKALQSRLNALKPVLGIFGSDTDIHDLINDFALARGVLTQKENNKAVAVSKATTEMNRPIYGQEQQRLQKLYDRLPPDETETPESIQGRRVVSPDGNTYTVIRTDDAGLATEVRSDKNEVFTGDKAAEKVMNGGPDIIQSGIKVLHPATGKEYTVNGMIYRDNGEAWVDLRDGEGKQTASPVRILRGELEKSDGSWELAQPEAPQPPKQEEPPAPERITSEPLTQELALRDPEKFKELLIQKLGEKHPLAAKAWDYLVQKGLVSLDKVGLDPRGYYSSTQSGNITLGIGPAPVEFKNKYHFEDQTFDYERENLYRFSHEMTHNLVFLAQHDEPPAIRGLVGQVRDWRRDEGVGLSALGTHPHYKDQGPEKQAWEDVTELVNMYLYDPTYFKRFTNFLSDPAFATERQRVGVRTLSETDKNSLYTLVETTVQKHIGGEKPPESPVPPEQPLERKVVTLTNPHDMVGEMMSNLGATDRDQVSFETAPDIIIPFLQKKLAESATIIEPLQGSIINDADPAKRKLKLKGKVSAKGSTAEFNVTLKNSDQGLQIIRERDGSDIAVTGWTSRVGREVVEAKLADINTSLKEQIDKELSGLGKVQKVQIGDGVLVCDVKKS